MSTVHHDPYHVASLVGDAERDLVCDQLCAHFGDGRLVQADFDRRMGVALQARTRPELRTALAGLPAQQAAVATPPARRVTTGADVLVAIVSLLAVCCLVGVTVLAGASNTPSMVVGLVLGACGGGAAGMGLVHLLHRMHP